MQTILLSFRPAFWICLIILLNIIIKILFYSPHHPYWDASVYVLMGKYIFSGGEVGFLEPQRPILWPLVLGNFWKLGLDPILIGRILELAAGAGCIYLVYKIGKTVFNTATGFLAAIFLSVSPSYFYFGNTLYTEIPSTFLALLAVKLFVEDKSYSSGFFSAFSFLTKYSQLSFVVVLSFAEILKRRISFLLGFGTAFFLVVSLLHKINDGLGAIFSSAQSVYSYLTFLGQGFFQALVFYVWEESLLLGFAIFGIYRIFKNGNFQMRLIVALLCSSLTLAFLMMSEVYPNLLSTRFLVPSTAILYLLVAYGFEQILVSLENRFLKVMVVIFIISATLFNYSRIQQIYFPEEEFESLRRYVETNQAYMGDSVWISNPSTVVTSNLRIEELIYFPVFDHNKAKKLLTKLKENPPQYILFEPQDFPCRPTGIKECEDVKRELIRTIKSKYNADLVIPSPDREAAGGIFRKIE